jgi:hypothetical protein
MTILNETCLVLVDDNAVYDPAVHTVGGLKHRLPKLTWRDEDSFWQLNVTVLNVLGGFFMPKGKLRCFFSEKSAGVWKLRFDGRMKIAPFGTSGFLIDLEFQARPKIIHVDVGTGQQLIQDQDTVARRVLCGETVAFDSTVGAYGTKYVRGGAHETDPWFLFTPLEKILPFDTRKAEEILSAETTKLHWPRLGGDPVAVDTVFGNGTTIDLGARFVAGSFKFQDIQTPITRVDVTMKAAWDQKILRIARIEQASQDTDAIIGTLSGGDWSNFPRPGTKVGDWTVTRSSVQQVPPSNGATGYSVAYNLATSANGSMDASAGPSITRSFQRFFFDFDLELQGIQTIKRTETLKFSVFWGGQIAAGFEGETSKIDLTCDNLRYDNFYPSFTPGVFIGAGGIVRFDGLLWQATQAHVMGSSVYAEIDYWQVVLVDQSPIGSPEAGVFFSAPAQITASKNDGGVAIVNRNPIPAVSGIRYALNQAIARIADSVRIPSTFDVPWEFVQDITGQELISVTPADMNGKKVVGKVTSISVDVHKGIATIGMASNPGTGGANPSVSQPQYGAGLVPYAGIISFDGVNDYLQQEAYLSSLAQPISVNVQQAIESMKTGYSLRMTPISNESSIDRQIYGGQYHWYGPQQIDLGTDDA